MKHVGRWFSVMILLCALACGLLLEEGREVIAEIEGKPIRLKELLAEIRTLPFDERAKTNDADASVRLDARRDALNSMINQRLLVKEAESRGFMVSDEEINAAFQEEEEREKAMENLMEGMKDTGARHQSMKK